MDKRLLLSVIFAALLLCTLQSFSQKTYYVSPTGSDANAGTLAAPFLTLKKALGKSDMSIILVRGGTYYLTGDSTVSINKVGTAAKIYTMMNYPGERPLFVCSGLNTGKKGFSLSGSYWYIKGIDITKARDNGMYITGANNVVEFCSFSENEDSGMQLSGGATNNAIINCDSYYNKDATSENADGFAVKLDVSTGNSFKGCRSWQNSDDGWDGYMRPSDNIFTTLDSCWSFQNGYLKTGVLSGVNGDGNGFKLGGGDDVAGVGNGANLRHNFTVTRCLAFDNRKRGFDQNNNAGSITLYNCTAYRNKSQNFNMGGHSLVAGSIITVKDCVSYKSGSTNNLTTTPKVYENNSWQNSLVVDDNDFVTIDTAGMRGPRKADGSLPDITFLHLKTGSDLINAGQDVGLAYNGTAPDLGAFETNAVVPVKMISFEVVVNANGVVLTWKMATETANKGWTVERSVPGSNTWNELGFVNGANNSSVTTNYAYTDKNNLQGSFFYRLKQVDIDGRVSYTPVLLIKTTRSAVMELSAYPNPFLSSSTIRFNVPEKGKVLLQVFTTQGQLIYTVTNETLAAGTYQKLINGQGLATGKYIVKLSVDNKTVTNSIIKTQ